MLSVLTSGFGAAFLAGALCWVVSRSGPGRVTLLVARLGMLAAGTAGVTAFLLLYHPQAWLRIVAEELGGDGVLYAGACGGAVAVALSGWLSPKPQRTAGAGKRLLMLLAPVLLAGTLSACIVLPNAGQDNSDEAQGLDQRTDVLVAMVTSPQITFRRDADRLEPVCSCGVRVTFWQISEYAREAIVAVEDSRFWDHRGVDPIGLLRAGFRTVLSGFTTIQGGSSITEQVAKNLLLDPRRDVGRKIQEKVLALSLENAMPKTDILAAYMNGVTFGHVNGRPVVGIEGAARLYFHRSAEELSLLEGAMLAGMVQAPSLYSTDPEAMMRRAEVVLRAMVAKGFITKAEAVRALKSSRGRGDKLPFDFEPRSFMDWTLKQVRREHPTVALTTSTRIPITLQVETQAEAEGALKDALVRIDIGDAEAAYVVTSFKGAVLAMIGQRDYGKTQINLAVDTNSQAASTFKAYSYAAGGLMVGNTAPMPV